MLCFSYIVFLFLVIVRTICLLTILKKLLVLLDDSQEIYWKGERGFVAYTDF